MWIYTKLPLFHQSIIIEPVKRKGVLSMREMRRLIVLCISTNTPGYLVSVDMHGLIISVVLLTDIKDSDQTAQMRSLIWACAVRTLSEDTFFAHICIYTVLYASMIV